MLGRLLLPLCLCCLVLCAFVGVLSQRAIDEAEQVSTEVIELDCGSLIDNPPKGSTGILIRDFVFVGQIATLDRDGDDKWDEIAVPLFSRDGLKSKIGCAAVIACFHDVPDLETLKQRLAGNELQVNYRASDQEFNSNLHTKLAMKFKSMDFKNSPVVTIGHLQPTSVLGEESLKTSYRLGAIAICGGVLSLVYMVVTGLLKNFKMPTRNPRRKVVKKKKSSKRTNPGNYDVEPTGGVLDRVRSMRDQPAGEQSS